MTASSPGAGALDRIASFRFVYVGIFAYVVLSLSAVELAETLLTGHFERVVDEAVRVSPADGPVIEQVQTRLAERVNDSVWVRVLGTRVSVVVIGADGKTPVYLGGRTLPPPPDLGRLDAFDEALRVLPAIATVDVTVPPASLLAGAVWALFGAVLVPVLFVHNRRLAQQESLRFDEALAAREATANRARSIQSELEKVQRRLSQVEPLERAHGEEIQSLQEERSQLQARLAELSERETSLRQHATASRDLEQERRALEDLLEEAVQDLEEKESEIGQLQDRLRQASRGGGSRSRAGEQLGKRMRTLYRNLEIDDRAIQDIVSLGDESLRLRAEEALKRLDDDPETAGARRKVGGLPQGQNIFELGFAGKGRIYYARGRQRGFRVLAVGGKASQKTDLEYLSRVSLG